MVRLLSGRKVADECVTFQFKDANVDFASTVAVVGAGVAVGPAVGIAEGVSDADVEAEVVVLAVVDAACDALLAAWLLLVDDDVQPAIDNEATITSAIKANAFLTIQAPLTEERIKRVQRRRHSLSVVV